MTKYLFKGGPLDGQEVEVCEGVNRYVVPEGGECAPVKYREADEPFLVWDPDIEEFVIPYEERQDLYIHKYHLEDGVFQLWETIKTKFTGVI